MNIESNDDDILKEITNSDVLALKELYKINWPKWIITYYHLDIVCRWQREHGHNIKFYCPDGRWDDGTIVTITEQGNFTGVTLFTLERNNERLRKALKDTKRLKWNSNTTFHILHKDQYATVLDAVNDHELVVSWISQGVYQHLPAAKAIAYEYKLPPGTFIGPLNESHIEQINAIWPHNHPNSIQYLSNLVKYNYGLGLFLEETKELCSWAMKNDYGMLAILQTEEKHKKKGYGTIITKAMCKKLAEEGMDIVVCIMIYNIPSLNMFKKLGFKIIDYTCWLGVNSK